MSTIGLALPIPHSQYKRVFRTLSGLNEHYSMKIYEITGITSSCRADSGARESNVLPHGQSAQHIDPKCLEQDIGEPDQEIRSPLGMTLKHADQHHEQIIG